MLAQFLLEGTDLGLGCFPQTSAVWFHIPFGLNWSGMGVGFFQGILRLAESGVHAVTYSTSFGLLFVGFFFMRPEHNWIDPPKVGILSLLFLSACSISVPRGLVAAPGCTDLASVLAPSTLSSSVVHCHPNHDTAAMPRTLGFPAWGVVADFFF